jgi:hypothetical protein
MIRAQESPPLKRTFSLAVPCAFSEEGLEVLPRMNGRHGYIVGESRNRQCWSVLLQGRKTRAFYHKSFIAPSVPFVMEGIILVMPHLRETEVTAAS